MIDRRRVELAESLAEVRARIDAACDAAGRPRGAVRMLAVTKTFPASDVALLVGLGLSEFAENRDQEAAPKAAELAAALPGVPVRWHMVGRMQRNKARSVARWASEVQSVDSARLAGALARAVSRARELGERTDRLAVLIQASLDGDPSRGGVPLSTLPELAATIVQSGELILRGVMAVAPVAMSPSVAFETLAAAADRLRAGHPEATELSAGMSGDLEEAIAHGATCVRVGTALLGRRG